MSAEVAQFIDKDHRQQIIDAFHRLYCSSYSSLTRPTWLGQVAQKCPLDLWIYQEIIFETIPDVIIECGTCEGGSALFLAQVCEMVGTGKVIAIDNMRFANSPQHPRLQYIYGDVLSRRIFKKLGELVDPDDRVMVILDDDHTRDHVLTEMRVYGQLVTKDCYMIVEDSNIHGHPAGLQHPEGPYEAIEAFMLESYDFVIDSEREKFLMTFNPNGFLKRIT